MFPWVSITPFGSPVVPDVNMISATSSLETPGSGGSGNALVSCARSSNRTSGMSSASPPPGVNRETNASDGPALETTFATKSSGDRRSSGTAITPARMQPKKEMTHCGQLGPHSSARSPFFRPRSRRSEATFPASSHSSSYDHCW